MKRIGYSVTQSLNHSIAHSPWLFFIVTCICLVVSAFYEFIESWVAIASGSAADEFLATEGDIWDTQWDMFLALCGAIASQILLVRWHDRQLAAIARRCAEKLNRQGAKKPSRNLSRRRERGGLSTDVSNFVGDLCLHRAYFR